MVRTGRENLTKRGDVKAAYDDLRQLHGAESKPVTAITRRMVFEAIEHVLPERCARRTLGRAQLMMAIEVMLGLRVGEALTGGDFHGLLANHLTILRRLGDDGRPTGPEYVEGRLEHSKTKRRRIITAVGQSSGEARVRFAELLRAYWRDAGFRIVHRNSGGYRVEGPDYSVVRVSLTALAERAGDDERRFDELTDVLRRSSVAEVRRWADYTRLRGAERLSARSMDKRYINVIGSHAGDARLNTVMYELDRAGFGGKATVVPGPLMRATHGERLGLAHMPLQPGSTYQVLHDSLDQAYICANKETPDPELNLDGRERPKWGHHSFRRGALTCARNSRDETGATDQEIDIVFGWNEAMYSAKMQLHYDSDFDFLRRAAVTSRM